MTEDFIDYEEESTFEVPEDLFEDVSTGRNERDDYEAKLKLLEKNMLL